jgi:filamentous hemagglutinin
VQELQNRLGFSDARKEMIRDAMVVSASMGVVGKAGRGSAGGAKGISDDLSVTSRPLGLGSTGRTVANNLSEQLAMKEVMSNPASGSVVPMRNGMTDSRWPGSDGWVKMTQNVNGVEVHYVRNTNSGAVDDFKFK